LLVSVDPRPGKYLAALGCPSSDVVGGENRICQGGGYEREQEGKSSTHGRNEDEG